MNFTLKGTPESGSPPGFCVVRTLSVVFCRITKQVTQIIAAAVQDTVYPYFATQNAIEGKVLSSYKKAIVTFDINNRRQKGAQLRKIRELINIVHNIIDSAFCRGSVLKF